MPKIGEQIRGIAGYADGYGIDEKGNVYTFKQHRQRKMMQHDHKGYQRVFLFKNNVRKSHFVHRLVAEAFIENPILKEQVNHKDGNKRNNSIENLEWCTKEENQKHSRDVLGNTGRGTRNANHGYKKSKFYPSENLRSKLIELGIKRNKHDIVSLGEILTKIDIGQAINLPYFDGSKWGAFFYSNDEESSYDESRMEDKFDTEADARASMLIYLLENKLIEL